MAWGHVTSNKAYLWHGDTLLQIKSIYGMGTRYFKSSLLMAWDTLLQIKSTHGDTLLQIKSTYGMGEVTSNKV